MQNKDTKKMKCEDKLKNELKYTRIIWISVSFLLVFIAILIIISQNKSKLSTIKNPRLAIATISESEHVTEYIDISYNSTYCNPIINFKVGTNTIISKIKMDGTKLCSDFYAKNNKIIILHDKNNPSNISNIPSNIVVGLFGVLISSVFIIIITKLIYYSESKKVIKNKS